MTKVAIITRTKDRPLFLARALESVSNQTHEDYVHVIINDGGDVDAVNNLVAKFPTGKIRVFHRGSSSNAPDTLFNESIERVKSDYIAVHDDDDTWHTEFLEAMSKKLDEEPELGAVVARADKVIEEVRGGSIKHIKSTAWMPDLKVINLYRQCIENQMSAGLTMYRRSAYEAVGRFDDTLAVAGDWELGIRILLKYEVAFLDPGFALANYHHRKYSPGREGNSIFAGNDSHRYYTNLIMNKYLRKELADGKLGVGYIMSKTKYNQSQISRMVQKVTPGFVAKRLKNKIQG